MNLTQLMEKARDAARQAGGILAQKLEKGFSIEHKGRIDLVTDADRASQDFLTGELGNALPDAGFLGEEGLVRNPEAPTRWIIDPLDGTTNFAHSHPVFSISIALEIKGELAIGVVFDPCRDEMFSAIKGQGAMLNGGRIAVSSINSLEQSLLATGFPYDIRENPVNNLAQFGAMMMRTQGVRRCGSAALELCYVACGRQDAFWEFRLNPWDTAAGVLIVREAGGKVTDLNGNFYVPGADLVLASNGIIHEQVIQALASI